jgi:hypothetical protein
MRLWIVIYGDVVEGFSFVGPFETEDAAEEYAESRTLGHHPRTIAQLEAP